MIISKKLRDYKKNLPTKDKLRQSCIALIVSVLILGFGYFLEFTGAAFLSLIVYLIGGVYFLVILLTVLKLTFVLFKEKKAST